MNVTPAGKTGANPLTTTTGLLRELSNRKILVHWPVFLNLRPLRQVGPLKIKDYLAFVDKLQKEVWRGDIKLQLVLPNAEALKDIDIVKMMNDQICWTEIVKNVYCPDRRVLDFGELFQIWNENRVRLNQTIA